MLQDDKKETKCKLCLGKPIGVPDIENLCVEHRKQFILGKQDRKYRNNDGV